MRLNINNKINISICGMMGSGKSAVGKILALKLGYNFIDVDKMIEIEAKKTIKQIFEEDGEQYFRDLEEEITINILEYKETLVSLIPEYDCMAWTVSITEELVTTNIVLPDYDSNSCDPAEVTIWTWERTKDSNEYTFTKGLIEVSIYNITVSGNQMTWTDQFDGAITIWNKIEE